MYIIVGPLDSTAQCGEHIGQFRGRISCTLSPCALPISKQEEEEETHESVLVVRFLKSDLELEPIKDSLISVQTTNQGKQWSNGQVRSHTRCPLECPNPPCKLSSRDALLADRKNLLEHQPTLCLELGCGSGYVITSLALIVGQEAHYIATDINPNAVRVTRGTLEAHGVHAELITTNIASGLEKRLAGLVDVIVVNPPYVPTPEDEVGCEGIASAWAGGENGRRKQSLRDMPSNERKGLCFQNRCPEIDRRRKSTNHQVLAGFDSQLEAKGMVANKTVSSRVKESLLSQFHIMPFLRGSNKQQ
ncbi:hemK methyltransferase family member 2 [Prunus yedoensis var. nudiflora]|uniref:HemK methyltransferase family member 2 n=1 Tax=Prunus yedoensis var. nudiflora TaxID=2094558 RepID=A0A314Y153_PRUYE|nr:hemK methyltransferase family member 2 [Prunus yedoensis var. nudiflora]